VKILLTLTNPGLNSSFFNLTNFPDFFFLSPCVDLKFKYHLFNCSFIWIKRKKQKRKVQLRFPISFTICIESGIIQGFLFLLFTKIPNFNSFSCPWKLNKKIATTCVYIFMIKNKIQFYIIRWKVNPLLNSRVK
jgi:hypothetical protein